MQSLLFDSAIFVFSLGVCALFAFMETSVTAMRLFKIKELERTTTKYRSFLYNLEHRPQYVLISILIATNTVCIMSADLAQDIIKHLLASLNLPEGVVATLGITVGAVVVSLFGEIIPKSIAQAKSGLLSSMLWLPNFIYLILTPISIPLIKISEYFTKSDKDDDDQIVSEKELQFLVHYVEKKGIMESDKVSMLKNVFRMGSTHVKEILIPNSNIISVDITSDVDTILKLFENYRYSRFPVFEDNPENIIGIIYQKDLFLNLQLHKNSFSLKEITKPIIFVPDSLKVSELLKEFKSKSIHMAMVLDEYGSTTGLVTLEDALEEIVGDITDEHDPNEGSDKISVIVENKEWLVDATADLDRLEEYLHISFHVETAVTLGGFLTEQAQHLPTKGEKIYYKHYCFTVEKANKKRILRVYIKRTERPETCKTDPKKTKSKAKSKAKS